MTRLPLLTTALLAATALSGCAIFDKGEVATAADASEAGTSVDGATQPVPAPPLSLPGEPAAAAPAPGRGEAFLARDADQRTASSDRLRPPASPHVLQAGSTIPAALVTGIRSDLPGQVTAQVTEPVYDSPTGRHLLIPQGSRLIGQYDAEVGYGQERVLLVWTRLILPDGRSLVLERQPGADAAGYAGVQDRVDNHWGRLFRAGLLSTLLGVGAELGNTGDSDIARAIRDGAQQSVGDAGQEVVRRQLEIRPTLTVRPGHPVRVIVTRDLILEPYGDRPCASSNLGRLRTTSPSGSRSSSLRTRTATSSLTQRCSPARQGSRSSPSN